MKTYAEYVKESYGVELKDEPTTGKTYGVWMIMDNGEQLIAVGLRTYEDAKALVAKEEKKTEGFYSFRISESKH